MAREGQVAIAHDDTKQQKEGQYVDICRVFGSDYIGHRPVQQVHYGAPGSHQRPPTVAE